MSECWLSSKIIKQENGAVWFAEYKECEMIYTFTLDTYVYLKPNTFKLLHKYDNLVLFQQPPTVQTTKFQNRLWGNIWLRC